MIIGIILCILLLGVLGRLEASLVGLALFGGISMALFLVGQYSELFGVFCLDFSGQILVVLRVYIRFLMVIGRAIASRFSRFNSLIICIGILLVGAFSVRATFLFFILFESVLFPTLLLIIG